MRSILVLVAIVLLNSLVFGQSVQTSSPNRNIQGASSSDQKVVDLPLLNRKVRPKITLQQALKLAEDYIERNKIDISSYYLLEARMILYGGDKEAKEPRWFFWWVHESGAMGHYVEITVSMDWKVTRQPSM